MARRWSVQEEDAHRSQLWKLYVEENRTISQIAEMLDMTAGGVYDRLKRLNIGTLRSQKTHFNNQRSDIRLPTEKSVRIAELLGILLGDGHVSHFQVMVTLGTKEQRYAAYVQAVIKDIFGGHPRITISSRGDRTVYLGSTAATRWLISQGLVRNKVASQVDIPAWIFEAKEYKQAFIRGFFDTDGSVYALRWGVQLSFTNRSLPLLHSLQRIAGELGYRPSAVCGFVFYITHRDQVERFFLEVKPANQKHCRRFDKIMRRWRSSKRTRL